MLLKMLNQPLQKDSNKETEGDECLRETVVSMEEINNSIDGGGDQNSTLIYRI